MTKRTVTFPEAVSAINSAILQAQQDGWVPAFSYGDACLPDPKGVGLHCVNFPSYHMEFGKEFGSRVTLSFRASFLNLNRAPEFQVGTSGSLRSIEETQVIARALAGVTTLAANIREYMDSVDMVPTEEARAYQAGEDAERTRRYEEAKVANAARAAEEKRVKALKSLAVRRLNKAAGTLPSSEWRRIAELRDAGKYQEVVDALAALK